MAPSLSVVIVSYASLPDLRQALPALGSELSAGDEVIIVDNFADDALAAELPRLAPTARLIRAPENLGFAAGANLGAATADGDVLVLLNPDAVVQPGWAEALRHGGSLGFDAWMALVTMDGGRRVNTSGGVLHFTGLGWAGQAGLAVEAAPEHPREVAFLSGACLAIPLARWRALDGFASPFFMYCEDVDLSLRLRLAGHRLGLVPAARVVHDYTFEKGAEKWRLLERNRWATLLRTYPGPLLVLLGPALLATEAAIWMVALRGGWAAMKARATLDLLRWLPRLLRERRLILGQRAIGASIFSDPLTAGLDSPYLGAVGTSRPLRVALSGYWWAVRRALELAPGRDVAAASHGRPRSSRRMR